MAPLRDSLSNTLSDVVRDAVNEGVSPEEFIRCVQLCWQEALREAATDAAAVFDRAAKRK